MHVEDGRHRLDHDTMELKYPPRTSFPQTFMSEETNFYFGYCYSRKASILMQFGSSVSSNQKALDDKMILLLNIIL